MAEQPGTEESGESRVDEVELRDGVNDGSSDASIGGGDGDGTGEVIMSSESVGLEDDDEEEHGRFIPGGDVNHETDEGIVPPVKTRGPRAFFRMVKAKIDYLFATYPDLVGFFLNTIAALAFSVMNMIVKLSSKSHMGPFQMVFCRSVMQFTLGATNTILANKGPQRNPFGVPSKQITPLLAARGIIGIFAMICNFFSVQMMQIEEATIVSFLQPVLTATVGYFFLKEKLTKLEIFGMPFSFIGILLVAAPPSMFGWLGLDDEDEAGALSASSNSDSWFSSSSSEELYWGVLTPVWKRTVGALFGLAGCVGSAIAYCMTRTIGKRVHHTVIINWLSLNGMVVPLLPMILWEGFKMPHGMEWMYVVFVGVVAFIAQTFLTTSLRTGVAGRVAIANYTGIVWAFLWGVVVFHESPKVLSYIGTLFIGVNAGISIYKAWFIGKHHEDTKHVELQNLADDPNHHDDDAEDDHSVPIVPPAETPGLPKGVTPILP